MITANIIIPAELSQSAGHLAAVIGPSMADLLTFRNPNYEDEEGNQYIAVGVQVPDGWGDKVKAIQANPSLLQRPAFDTGNQIDLEAARGVAASTVILESPSNTPPDGFMVVGIGFSVIPSSFTRIQED